MDQPNVWIVFTSTFGKYPWYPHEVLNSLKNYLSNRKVVFQPKFFRGVLLNFWGVNYLKIHQKTSPMNPTWMSQEVSKWIASVL